MSQTPPKNYLQATHLACLAKALSNHSVLQKSNLSQLGINKPNSSNYLAFYLALNYLTSHDLRLTTATFTNELSNFSFDKNYEQRCSKCLQLNNNDTDSILLHQLLSQTENSTSKKYHTTSLNQAILNKVPTMLDHHTKKKIKQNLIKAGERPSQFSQSSTLADDNSKLNSYSNAGYEYSSNSGFEDSNNSNVRSSRRSKTSQASSTLHIHLSNSSCHSQNRKRNNKGNTESITGSSCHIQLEPIESYTEDISSEYSEQQPAQKREVVPEVQKIEVVPVNNDEETGEYTYTYYSEAPDHRTQDSEYTYTYVEPSTDLSETTNESDLYSYTYVYDPSHISTNPNSDDEYTFTYDEPNSEEQLLLGTLKNKKEEPVEKPKPKPVQKKQQEKGPKPTPRQKKIMEKIDQLTKNLNELQSTIDTTQADQRQNNRVGKLKNKLANLTGWKCEESMVSSDYYTDDRSYSYTFEYESEVFKKLKKIKPQLALQSPTEAVVSIPNEDENRPKLDLGISPIIDTESQDVVRQEKLRQLQEIKELQERLNELQKNLNPSPPIQIVQQPLIIESHPVQNVVEREIPLQIEPEVQQPIEREVNKVKKHIRVPKNEKERIMNNKQPKLKKIHKRVRVEKKKKVDLVNQPPLSPQNEKIQKLIEQQEKIVQQQQQFIEQHEKVTPSSSSLNESGIAHLSPVKAAQVSTNNFHKIKGEVLPLLEETSSDESPLTSLSGLQLLDEGSSDEVSVSIPTLNLSIVAVENVPDVDVFCVAYIDNTNEARKTRTIPQGQEKTFNENFEIPCPNEKNKLILLVKKQDLIKEDKLLGVLKIEINPASFTPNKSISKWISLNTENGVQTQSRIHIVLSMKNTPSLANTNTNSNNKQITKSSESELGTGVFVLQPPNQMNQSPSDARNSLNNNDLESTSFFKDLLDDKNASKKPTSQENHESEDKKKNGSQYSGSSRSSKKKRSIQKLDVTDRDVDLSKNSVNSSLSDTLPKEQAVESIGKISGNSNKFDSESEKSIHNSKEPSVSSKSSNHSSSKKNSSVSKSKNSESDHFSAGFSQIDLKMEAERNSNVFKSFSNLD